jgi:hypothetical protein
VRSTQYNEDVLALKNLSISELYVKGDIYIWLPILSRVHVEGAIWPRYQNRYALIQASLAGRAPREPIEIKGAVRPFCNPSNGTRWYDFDVSVVVGNSAEFPEKLVASKIGFFVGDEIRELRAKKLLKGLTLFVPLEQDYDLAVGVVAKVKSVLGGEPSWKKKSRCWLGESRVYGGGIVARRTV